MIDFRTHTPTRRNITTKVGHYHDHKSNLRIDYIDRCGYCNDIDKFRFSWFEIDHLVPQKYLKTISENDYSNLVYSCRSCNNAKRAKWPTGDEKVHHRNDEGFVDPCDDEYNNQFSRLNNGRIIPQSKLGEWIYNSLKLYKPQHEIIWNIEELENLILEIKKIRSVNPENEVIKDLLLLVYEEFHKYINELFKY